MSTSKYRGFRTDIEIFFEAKKKLYTLFIDVLGELYQLDYWNIPYFNTFFANGNPDLDGNPMFSAIKRDKSQIIRIIAVEVDDGVSYDAFLTQHEGIPLLTCTTTFSDDSLKLLESTIVKFIVN